MPQFKDLAEQATPVDADLIAIQQASDNVSKKLQLSNIPIVLDLASTAVNKGASLVAINDAGGLFASVDVEAALQELGVKLDGIDQWVSATSYIIGDVVWLSDNNTIYRCVIANSDVVFNPVNWIIIGGAGTGAGDANTIHLIEADALNIVGDIDLTGKNADFDGGGVITASSLSLSGDTADLIKGVNQSIHYDPNANGSGDYFGFTRFIPQGFRGRSLGFSFELKNDSTTLDDDFRFAVKQKDGSQAGNIQYFDMPAFNGANNISIPFNVSSFIASDCENIEFGWQNQSTTTTVQLTVDNILVSASDRTVKNLTDFQEIIHSAAGTTLLDRNIELRFDPSNFISSGPDVLQIVDDVANTRTKFIATKKCRFHASAYAEASDSTTSQVYQIVRNGTTIIGQSTIHPGSGSETGLHVSTPMVLEEGDFVTFRFFNAVANNANPVHLAIVAVAETEHVIRSTENVQPARYKTNAAQAIANNSMTRIDLEDKDFDNQELVTTGASWVYTAPSDGKFLVSSALRISSTGTWDAGESAIIHIFKNGSIFSRVYETSQATHTNILGLEITDIVSLVKGYTISIRVLQNSGAGITLAADDTDNFVSITKIDKNPLGALPLDTQFDLSVSGTGWATTRAVGIPYQTADGAWRMKFNIRGTRVSGAPIGSYTITITGVTFKNVASFTQPVIFNASNLGADGDIGQAWANPNLGTLTAAFNSGNILSAGFSGDVELDGKPTFL